MNDQWDHTYDVVVVGSGAAGMAAALTARLRGLTALVLEKTEAYGGSTALSGGAIWVPDNFHLDEAGLGDTPEKARAYLDATVGDRVSAARKDAYVTHGPRMVREFHDRTDVRFVYTPATPTTTPSGSAATRRDARSNRRSSTSKSSAPSSAPPCAAPGSPRTASPSPPRTSGS
ncbi:FAD-dependent oxidoreductase [Streptomyces diastatochromogenes]|nr:FAD-dependent oxidoreductase [Streptomyces diastatochromogenes]